MMEVHLRFYEELNDYIPVERKKCTFAMGCREGSTVADLLQAAGVPLTEVDLILVNGSSVDPSHVLCDQDRVSAYPVFESLDVAAVTRVREEPLRRPRFIADPGLEQLAACLRRCGFDVCCATERSLNEVDLLAEKEARILLTHDPSRLRRTARICRIRESVPERQAEEVIERLDLFRCLRNSKPS